MICTHGHEIKEPRIYLGAELKDTIFKPESIKTVFGEKVGVIAGYCQDCKKTFIEISSGEN